MNLNKSFRLDERVNIVDFLKLSKDEQDRIYKGCINKRKLNSLNDVAQILIKKYESTERVFNYYSCETCGGFHLTSGGKKKQKKIIKRMILKSLADKKSD